MKLNIVIVLGIIFFGNFAGALITQPDKRITPGKICTEADPDFSKYDYPTQVARCRRHVTATEKAQVAHLYGDIPKSEWPNYEFDHLISLCVGGANSVENLWPQPIEEARKKDVIENEVCTSLQRGTMTQEQAIQKLWDWFAEADHQAPAGWRFNQ